MAWLEQKQSGTFHIVFRLGKEKYRRSLKTKCKKEASARHSRIEENVRLVESGRLVIPDDADLVSFLLSDGKLTQRVNGQKRIRIGQLYDRYSESLPQDSMEANSLYTASIHMRHISELIDARLELRGLTAEHLQSYVNKRSLQPGRHGRNVSSVTIKKELATFRSIWNWAITHGYIATPLPLHGLKYPKVDEKPPFRTREEIAREIDLGNLSEQQQSELWHSLYLRTDEISDVLSVIKETAGYDYLYPMAAVAAYTGARRSELCRSEVRDIDLEQRTILLREKKRNKSKRTYRQAPIATSLTDIMETWLNQKRDSQFTFPCGWIPTRKHDPQAMKRSVLPAEARHHLEQALRHSKWSVIPGWHVFRHSFVSNCASRGVDQRMIDDWVGHQTDEQRKRYRHLFPDTQQKEIDRVF